MSLLDPWVGSKTGQNLVNNELQQQAQPPQQPQGQPNQPQQAPPPAGAQGYDPLGRPYFGPGITGTFKKYYYQLMGSPTSGMGLDNWNAIVDDFKKAETQSGQEWKDTNKDILKRSAAGLFGADVGKLEEQDTAALDTVNEKLKQREKELAEQYKLETGQNFIPSVNQSYLAKDELYQNLTRQQLAIGGQNIQKATSFDVNGQNISLLAPVVRATTVGLTALMDLLQEPAQKTEQALGAIQKARDTTEGVITTRNDLADTFLNMIPPIAAFNAAKFLFSPTSAAEKTEALKTGWDSGRIFYTQMFDDAVQQEFESRAAAGEDPQLLALELANPWAEMGGQLILDPLNVAGYFSKVSKVATITDDAIDAVKVADGLADSPDFMNGIESLSKVATEGDAVRAGDNVVNSVVDYFHGEKGLAKTIVPEQKYTTMALNAAGNQMKAIRNMGNTFTWIIASITKDGRSMDDVNDAITALVKLSSKDPNEVRDAFSALTHMPSPMTYFNQSSLQTSAMIRNLLSDADGVLDVKKFLAKVQGLDNWTAYGNKLKSIMDDAAKFEYPSVSEMKRAAESFKEGTAAGNKIPANTARLAEQFKQLEKNHPGMVKLAAVDEFLTANIKNPINRILGTFYFSLSPGFATRNYLQNNFTVLIDDINSGSSAWFRDGKYMSDKFIGEELGKLFEDGLLPPSISDYKPISKEFNASEKILGVIPSMAEFSNKIELSAAKRIFYKHFRDTMDKMVQPGRALPAMEDFKRAGFTEQQVGRFTSLIRSNYYNIKEATRIFTQEYAEGGPDVWRMVDTLLSPKAYQGLTENGMMDEIMQFVKRDDVGPKEIEEFMDGLVAEQKTRAGSIVDDPVGMSSSNPFVRERADLFASSEKYTDPEVQSYLDQLFERSVQTRDKYVEALIEIRNKSGDPELANFLDSLMKREPDDRIRKLVAGVNQNTRSLIDKARKGKSDLRSLWNKLGSPTEWNGGSFDDFRKAAWEYTLREKVPQMWDSHFGAVFAESEKYATKYGVTELLQQAQDMNKEAQQWRTSVYRMGQQDPLLPPSAENLARQTGTDAASQTASRAETLKANAEAAKQYQKTYGKAWTVQSVEKNVQKIATDIFAGDADTFANMSYKNMELLKKTKPDSQQAKLIDQYISEVEKHVKGFSDDELTKLATPTGGNNRFDTVTSVAQRELQARGLTALEEGANVAPEVLKKVVDVEAQIAKNVFGDSAELFSNASITTGKAANAEKLAEYERQLGEAIKSFSDEELQAAASTNVIKDATMTPLQYVASQELKKRKGVAQQIPPPYLGGSTPTMARMHAETAAGSIDALNQLKRKMLDNFGVKAFDEATPQLTANLTQIAKQTADKIAEGRLIAQKVGEHWRDFALLPYGETTHLDHALTYIYPYSFWYSRSYSGWAKRLVSDPQIIAAYAKFKDMMAQIHKDSPEWWKQNVTLPEFMWGLNNGNPMYVNLEATLWPLYGLTGTDFNDSKKRADWMTSTIDDMGKFGPSMWAPINLAIATGLSLNGEQEAASRWAGRVVPQTATLKAVMAQLGATPLELDPAVQMFSGKGFGDTQALDPYERNRVGRALAQMVTDGRLSEEQAIEVARVQEGEIWDQAVLAATQQRAPGQIASFFLGVGFKARTESDMQIDQFYAEYFKMQEMRSGGYLSPEQYKEQFNEMHEKYPFMDTVLLSRRAGEDRESAYAYGIISRIPPGMTSEIWNIVGIDPETTEKFYESGGSFEGWNEQEKQRFMTAMIDAGAILAIPSNASRQEWTAAKGAYTKMQDSIRAEYGDAVYDQIDSYYNMTDAEREDYLNAFPNVEMAMQRQTELIANSPLLSTYYGGLDTTYRYYSNKMYETLETEFGDDISDRVDYYYFLKDGGDVQGAKAFYNQEGLKAYFGRRSELMDELNRNVAKAASNIPDNPGVLVYNEPQNPVQEDLYDFATGPSQDQQIAQSVWGELSPYDQRLIEDYYNGEDLPYSVEKRLDYLGRDYGMGTQDILRLLGSEVIQ